MFLFTYCFTKNFANKCNINSTTYFLTKFLQLKKPTSYNLKNLQPKTYSIALTTAFSASFLVPSKPSTPETVVYFKTYFLPGFIRWYTL